MAELDAELSARLSRLAAAVPVPSGQLDVVHRDAVRARQQVRMAWLTPLVVLVIGVVAASALQIGPFAPGATPQPSGPITATTRDGDFTLSIEATKGTYLEGEPIDIWASLAYDGGESTVISHAIGAQRSPIGFGIDEPVFGAARLGPLWETGCTSTSLAGDSPLTVPFEKTADTTQPGVGELDIFMLDPQLHLNPGTWHLYANARFRLGDCLTPNESSATIEMQAQLEITVLPRPGETPLPSDGNPPEPTTPGPTETPTRAPENDGLGNQSMSDSGTYWIEIASDHRIYRESEPILINGTFKYLGDTAVEVQGLRPLVFSVVEPVHGINVDGAVTLECNHDRLLPGQEIQAPFHKGGGVSTLDPEYEAKLAYLQDPVFRLPPGSWHIRVSGWVSVSECGMPQERFSTEIEITVLADEAERMDLLTESDPGTVPQCRDRLTTGNLAREAGTGLGIQVEPGTVQKILWPYGYSAWDTPDGPILVNEAGQTIAQEGQRMIVDGLDEPGWLIRAGCIRAIVLID